MRERLLILLHAVVCRPPAALWADPVDVLAVVLDVARLAVDAVLRVDHQPHAVLAVLPRHVLVHAWKWKWFAVICYTKGNCTIDQRRRGQESMAEEIINKITSHHMNLLQKCWVFIQIEIFSSEHTQIKLKIRLVA